MSQTIDETDFLVIDFETTGLSPDRGDRVCEVGAAKVRGGAVVDSFTTLIDPQRPISPGAYAVNRISPSMLAGAPTFGTIVPRLSSMMKDAVIVAYNAPFDMGFLRHELRLAGDPLHSANVVDLLPLARILLKGLTRYGQDLVADAAGISKGVAHRAMNDVMTSVHILLLFSRVLKAHGLTTVEDFFREDLYTVLRELRLQQIGSAIEAGHDLRIRYFSPAHAEIAEKFIAPKLIRPSEYGTGPLVDAYCHDEAARRSYHVDRILEVITAPR